MLHNLPEKSREVRKIPHLRNSSTQSPILFTSLSFETAGRERRFDNGFAVVLFPPDTNPLHNRLQIFPLFYKPDQLLHIVKFIVISEDPFTVIYDSVFPVAFQTVQQHFFSISLRKQREPIGFYL